MDDFYTSLEIDSIKNDAHYEANLIHYLNNARAKKRWDYALRFSNALSYYYIYNEVNHRKADSVINAFLPDIEKCSQKKDIGDFHIAKIESYIFNQRQKEGLAYITEKALPFFETEKDSSSYNFAYSYLKAGEITVALNKFSESVGYLKQAETLFTKQNDSLFVLWTKNALSTLFSRNGLFEEAQKKRSEIYPIASKINQEQVAAMARIQAAIDAQFLGKSDVALQNIRIALRYQYPKSEIKEIVDFLTLSFAVTTYAQVQQKDSSNHYKKKLDAQVLKHKENPFLLSYYQTASVYNALANSNFLKAKKELLRFYKTIEKTRILEVEHLLAKTYEYLKDSKNSLLHYKRHTVLKDSINQSNSKRRFAYAKTIYETEKKDLQIKNQQAEIKVLDIKNKEKNKVLLFGSLVLLGLFLLIYLWNSRVHIEEKRKQQERFSQNLITSQEEERRRISRDLHDGVGQQLMLLTRKLKNVGNDALEKLSSNTLSELRSISRGLHSSALERLGFTMAVQEFIDELNEHSTMYFTADLEDIDHLISDETALHLFRMVQETLNNSLKHAHAKAASVTIVNEKDIQVIIKDNGKGFNFTEAIKNSKSLGMRSLVERCKIINARLEVDTQPNAGTTFTITLNNE